MQHRPSNDGSMTAVRGIGGADRKKKGGGAAG